MAYDKIVDSASLESGLTQICTAIREKNGESGTYRFPDIMAEKIRAISGADPTKSTIIITAPTGSTVTLYYGG